MRWATAGDHKGRPYAFLWRTLLVATLVVTPAVAAESPVMEALKTELARSMEMLGEQPVPPYFLSYEVTERETASANAAFGSLTSSSRGRARYLDIDLRVGNYELDNTRPIQGARNRRTTVRIPLDDDVDAIRSVIWSATDARYKQALEELTKVETDIQVKVEAEDTSADFSHQEPAKDAISTARLDADFADWERRARLYSEPFADHERMLAASASISGSAETRWFVNSEGSEIETADVHYRVFVSARTKADDGMTLPRYESFFSFTPDGLPDDATVLATVERMIADLAALRDAPLVDPYTGPAILSGRASGVFFHEILGHRVEGHRQKRADDGQTFKKKINERILPPGFSVTFDPGRRRLAGLDLVGSYTYDNQGVRGRPVVVVDDGILVDFLMSRTPIEGFPGSNGHGRKQYGFSPVSRQSNLIVEVRDAVSREALREQLLTMIRDSGRPFGLFIDDIQGGVTTTGRFMPNAFNVEPNVVYRIYPDGREELVRGVDLIGTPLTTLSRVIAADDQVAVFNGFCGAESGSVPVSAAAPGVLVSQIEVQKKGKSQERLPILPRPSQAAVDAHEKPVVDDHAGDDIDGVLFQAMRDELERSSQRLSMEGMETPYFLAYRVDEVEGFRVSARFGALDRSSPSKRRSLSVELRVGSPEFDNTNFLGSYGSGGSATLPLDDDYDALRRRLWLATDSAYKSAQRKLAGKRAALQNRTRDAVPDFADAQAVQTIDTAGSVNWTVEDAQSLARTLSALFRQTPGIHESRVHTDMDIRRSYYVNTEGTSYVKVEPWVQVRAWASTQAADGTILQDSEVFYARSDALPEREILAERVRAMAEALSARRGAESMDRYSGPVLFKGHAAAGLLAGSFAPRLVAVRVPVADGYRYERSAAAARNPFADKIGARVMPRFLDVRDDPTLDRYGPRRLHGGYRVDDEGVPAAPTILVERGRLRSLLTTRNPVEGIAASTGNRRGIAPVPTNLIVSTEQGLDDAEMHTEFVALIHERGNEFGIVVSRLSGSTVVQAAKVYPDGRTVPIRKAELSGFSVSAFKDIVAASATSTAHTLRYSASWASILRQTSAVYGSPRHDTIGSIVVPDLLFEEVTLRKPIGNSPRPPVLAHPFFEKGS
ncbi:MAG: metallopeptidase TldD-related protein [Gammaproteobacteria bacterium]|nr:metallopeptidase TldD-related protein [Gammaproteobacteria bacterium]